MFLLRWKVALHVPGKYCTELWASLDKVISSEYKPPDLPSFQVVDGAGLFCEGGKDHASVCERGREQEKEREERNWLRDSERERERAVGRERSVWS